MKCPVCSDTTLVIASREGIEIDHCPECRGVWLDRGELDKLIERSAPHFAAAPSEAAAPPPQAPPRQQPPPPRYEERRYDDRRYDDRRYDDDRYRRKKRRSFLEDIFDFD